MIPNRNKIEILYLSNLCSVRVFNYIFRKSKIKPRQEAQKFHRLLFEGFTFHQELCSVSAYSSLPVSYQSFGKFCFGIKKEILNGSEYNYAPLINIAFFKHIFLFLFTLRQIINWIIANRKSERLIICDALKLSMSSAALIAALFLPVKVVGIVTDLPGLMVEPGHNSGIKRKLFNLARRFFLTGYSGYILLTEEMNNVVNPNSRPYIIMEGLVDVNNKDVENNLIDKADKRIILYAGAIYEKYGVKRLLSAFMKLKNTDLALHIYGPGELEEEMNIFHEKDDRIIYKGVVPNYIVVKELLKATLLVNPRPTNELFTRYSFPSKNMEYMASGTPLLTTALPGMPKEYYDHVYIFNDESIDGMAASIGHIISKPREELHAFGIKGKHFILTMKNNYIQSERLLSYFTERLF